jgi:hypothetical protein
MKNYNGIYIPMKKKICVLTIVFFSLAAAVFPGQQQPGWKGGIEKRDGLTVVQNPKKPKLSGQVLSFAGDLSIGVAEGEEEYMFSRISGIAVDEEDNIYVLDYTEAHLDVYDSEGSHVKTIGKKGQGPGEMASPFSIAITKNKEIVIQDLNNRKFLFFSMDGTYLKSVSAARWIIVGARVDSRNNIIGVVSTMGAEEQLLELKKFDSALNPLLSFCGFSKPRGGDYNPFGPEIHWALLEDDRILCGYPEDYELNIFDPDGQPVLHIVREHDPIRVTEDDVEEIKKTLPAPVRVDFPRYHSAYQGLTVDDEGRLFIQTWEKTGDGTGFYYDVFDPAGRYAARVALPFKPSIWKKSKVYSIEENEEGFQLVKRYAVLWKQDI